jgi:hypothetical protein
MVSDASSQLSETVNKGLQSDPHDIDFLFRERKREDKGVESGRPSLRRSP